MTSHPDVGIQGPPLRNPSSSVPRPAQSSHQASRSVPHQAVAGLNTSSFQKNSSPYLPRDHTEPLTKRQKLDHTNAFTLSPTDMQREYGQASSPSNHVPRAVFVHKGQSNITLPGTLTPSAPRSSSTLPSFPIRPGKFARWGTTPVRQQARTVSQEEVQVKPYVLETPSFAPQYQNHTPTDFFPWLGNHSEDTLNDHSTKSGFYDRIQVSQNESNTARPAVWPGVKHKSGLQILSSLFVSVLDRRQAHGTVTAKCTFKPPPRVTLTDTKREAWLRDLANPTIPLRRLSRTIPHGIRGKTLLDHCLTKKIPVWRAVWLAKCVGANEIRAFKRKGTNGAFAIGGETKWIKDWTSNVEQFVAALVEAPVSPDWKTSMTYGLRLAKHLYADNLLDQEQFLLWIIKSFHACDLDLLPIWFLVLQSHRKEIMCFRCRGRKLVEALLEQLLRLSSSDIQDVCSSLSHEISALLRSLAQSDTACFVLPFFWMKYESVLSVCLLNYHPPLTSQFEDLRSRNIRLVRTTGITAQNLARTPREQFITILDTLCLPIDFNSLSEKALEIAGNSEILVDTVIGWSTTPYRSGLGRIYTAVRLLRRWKKDGWDLDQPILHFLTSLQTAAVQQKRRMFKLIAELVRSRLFSISKYLQWLMARGLDRVSCADGQPKPIEIQLLDNIPLHGVPAHILNLRQILMKAAGVPVPDQMETKSSLNTVLTTTTFLQDCKALAPWHNDATDLARLSGTVRFEISLWIRTKVLALFSVVPETFSPQAASCNEETPMTLDDFKSVREILETFEDFPILADVLRILSKCNDKFLLGAVTNTLNTHIDVFQSIGAAEEISQLLISRMEEYYTRSPADKPILLSLLDLGETLPVLRRMKRALQQELELCEPKNPIVACSPVSEHMVEALHSTDSDFLDEARLLLSSGTSMDRKTISDMFSTVAKRLQIAWFKNGPLVPSFVDILSKLRPFDPVAFDALMLDWLEGILWCESRPQLASIVVPLLCQRAMNLLSFIRRFVSGSKEDKHLRSTTRIVLDVVALFVTEPSISVKYHINRVYRFSREISQISLQCPEIVSLLVQRSLEACIHEDLGLQQRARTLVLSSSFLCLMQTLIVYFKDATAELRQFVTTGVQPTIASLALDRLIGNVPPQYMFSSNFESDFLLSNPNPSPLDVCAGIKNLLHVANDFNINICQLKLSILLAQSKEYTSNGTITGDSIIMVLVDETASISQSRYGIWTSLLSSLSEDHAQMFHERCASALFALMPDWTSVSSMTASKFDRPSNSLESLLVSMDATEDRLPADRSTNIITSILNSLTRIGFSESLARSKNNHPIKEDFRDFLVSECVGEYYATHQWIDLLLRLLAIHQGLIRQPSFSQQTLCQLLISLSLLLLKPYIPSSSMLSVRLFDTVAFFSDCLHPESRTHCVATLRDRHCLFDPRLRFIFGFPEREDDETLHITSTTYASSSSVDSTNHQTFPLRKWEMVQDATPTIGENDTSVSLTLLGARKAVL